MGAVNPAHLQDLSHGGRQFIDALLRIEVKTTFRRGSPILQSWRGNHQGHAREMRSRVSRKGICTHNRMGTLELREHSTQRQRPEVFPTCYLEARIASHSHANCAHHCGAEPFRTEVWSGIQQNFQRLEKSLIEQIREKM